MQILIFSLTRVVYSNAEGIKINTRYVFAIKLMLNFTMLNLDYQKIFSYKLVKIHSNL